MTGFYWVLLGFEFQFSTFDSEPGSFLSFIPRENDPKETNDAENRCWGEGDGVYLVEGDDGFGLDAQDGEAVAVALQQVGQGADEDGAHLLVLDGRRRRLPGGRRRREGPVGAEQLRLQHHRQRVVDLQVVGQSKMKENITEPLRNWVDAV